jgi:hypothetical protein
MWFAPIGGRRLLTPKQGLDAAKSLLTPDFGLGSPGSACGLYGAVGERISACELKVIHTPDAPPRSDPHSLLPQAPREAADDAAHQANFRCSDYFECRDAAGQGLAVGAQPFSATSEGRHGSGSARDAPR